MTSIIIIITKSFLRSFLRFVVLVLPAVIISALLAILWYYVHPYLFFLEHETTGKLNDGLWLLYVLLATVVMRNAMEKNQKLQGAINKAGELWLIIKAAEEVNESVKAEDKQELKRQEEQFFSLLKTHIQSILLHFIALAGFYLFVNCFTTHYETPLDGVVSVFEASSMLLIFYVTLYEIIDVFGGYWHLDTSKMPNYWDERICKTLEANETLGIFMVSHFKKNGYRHKK